ncbi:cupredoxin domain-containing protein [Methylocaldum sp.]|uniref:cupredoxin domain-containing protein n=1 Tax=Methylocaldum sp. TaxID=1969727 RepID=UPI002D4C25EC|nr:cupredoxin domain-containing protein [Methylocaldum sp.]HYE36331.1 cupredoxin domain-containing protein [Methylocaldum sp.]
MQNRTHSARFTALSVWLMVCGSVSAAETYTLTIKEHRFEPVELEVPAGQKIKLIVKNEDPTPEEFESRSLKREKIIPGKSQATVSVGPLDPGTYEFFGEFHEESAKGRIVAK